MAKRTNCLAALLCLVFSLSLWTPVSAQYPACPIKTDIEPSPTSKLRETTAQSQAHFSSFISWSDLDQTRYPQGHANVFLSGVKRSTVATFGRYGHKLPLGAEVQGIRVLVSGHQTGEGRVRDVIVQLRSGSETSENLAGDYRGTYFPDSTDGVWRYGDDDELWGVDWTADMINSDDFAVDIQLRNLTSKEVQAAINQVKIEVYYTEKHTLCAETCAVYFVDPVPGYSYEWKLPEGFQRKSSLTEDNSVNLAPMTADFGLHEICVSSYDASGSYVGECCRTFYYKDCRPSYIGDYVFIDHDNSNTQTIGDAPTEGIQVMLFDDFDHMIDMAITDEDGYYEFEIAEADKYYVQIALPDAMLAVQPNVGDDTLDSDLVQIGDQYRTALLDIAPGTVDHSIDFGIVRELILGDFVWEDMNNNGLQDEAEPGIAGVAVFLIDAAGDTILTTATDSTGAYIFDGIPVDRFAIGFDLPVDYQVAIMDAGDDDAIDSDIDAEGTISLVDYRDFDMPKLDIDAGLFRYASIGDYVFFDTNENGIQDDPDTAMVAVAIDLYNVDDELLATTESDSLGYYLFDSLVPGTYYVRTRVPDLIKPTDPNIGDDASIDSDLIHVEDGQYQTMPITVVSGENNKDIDLGFVDNTAKIGGIVFEDMQYDGQLNDADPKLNNITVNLFESNGDLSQTTQTDSAGYYQFEDILPGMYYLEFITTEGYLFTLPNVGNDATDSDVTEANGAGTSDILDIAAGLEQYDFHAGVYRYASIGDYVFLDWDENGIQSDGDTGLEGINLSIIDMQGIALAQQISAADGSYIFDQLLPGKYWISLGANELYLPAAYQQGDNPAIDSDLADFLFSDTIMLVSGQMEETIDFGFVNNYASISGIIFEDSKADAELNGMDTLMLGAEVWLYNADGTLVTGAVTDEAGRYTFENVLAGEYYLTFTLPNGYIYSTANITDTNGAGSTDIFTAAPGAAVDMGETGAYIPVTIGDYVFLDLNEDGIQNEGDEPFEGAELSLINATGEVLVTTVSDALGSYSFDNVTPGTYTIRLAQDDLYLVSPFNATDDALDSDLTEDWTTEELAVCSGQDMPNIDFGLMNNYASISGIIFEDSKADAELNGMDTLMVGAEVWLYNADGTLVTGAVTDEAGRYTFENVLAGEYYLLFTLPNGYIYSTANITDTNGAGSTDIFTAAPGAAVDMGETGAYVPVTIGDYVFLDLNEDGIQNEGDEPFEGAELSLVNAAGEVMATTVSDAMGSYSFDNVTPGSYTIRLAQDDLYLVSPFNATDDALDSDLTEDWTTEELAVCSGQDMPYIDFGLMNNYASISGIIFEDSKADAELNGMDTLMLGAEVWLYNADGTLVTGAATDEAGRYTFENVLAGEYYLLFTLPNGYIYSTANITDTNGAGSTDTFTAAPGAAVDMGETGAYIPVTIGDYVFLDLNEDGIQNEGDEPFEGAELSLINAAGEVMATTVSDAMGSYSFDNVTPGTYTIRLAQDDLYLVSPFNATDDALDSDLTEDWTTEELAVCSGQDMPNIDFGLMNNYASISGIIFEDSKADGELDAIDTLMLGAEVWLYNADGTLVTGAATDEAGRYTFENVLAGEYYLLFTLPNGYIYSTANITNVNGAGSTNTFTLQAGQAISMDNTGAYLPASVGDYVFLDWDENGIQNTEDTPLAGIELTLVNLFGEIVDATVSDETGAYTFDNVRPGNYVIAANKNELYLPTSYQEGNDTNVDSDLTEFLGEYVTDTIMLMSGMFDSSIDFGFVNNYATITGRLFEDKFATGIFEEQDSLINNADVWLYAADGTLVTSTTTDENGVYTIEDVLAGDYYITFTLEDYQYSTSNITGANGAGSTDVFTAMAGEDINIDDTGAYRLASIGDYVFLDINENGIQDDADQPLAGVTITLTNQGNTQTTISDENGFYTFENLEPVGAYLVEVSVSDEYLFTQPNVGDDTAIDSDGQAFEFLLCSGDRRTDLDIGLIYNDGSIAGSVFVDKLFDGQYDGDDFGLADRAVTLYDAMSNEIASTTTDTDGNYIFNNILTGDYYLVFDASDYQITTPNVGDDLTDSDVINASSAGSTGVISLAPGENLAGVNAGLYQLASIGDYVWFDENQNGLQDDDENGIADVAITLFDENSTEIQTTTSDADGAYTFDLLTPGNYYVGVTYPEDRTSTIHVTSDDENNSELTDANGTGTTATFALMSGMDLNTVDLGLARAGAIVSGDVWVDIDGDNTQTAVDTALAGIMVKLFDTEGNEVAAAITNAQGQYTIQPVQSGEYYIAFELSAAWLAVEPNMGDEASDSDITGANGANTTDLITVVTGEIYDNIDAGVEDATSTISGLMFEDKNANGINEDDEQIVDYTVALFDAENNQIATAVIDENGQYLFQGVITGEYYLTFTAPNGYIYTLPNTGDDATDSDVIDGMGNTATFNIGTQESVNIDAGVYRMASIGDYVWLDENRNGIQDADETGLENISIALINNAGLTVSTTSSDAEGFYTFESIVPGTYTISLSNTEGWVASLYQQGTDATIDSDLQEASMSSTEIMLMSGENNKDFDFGLYANPGQITGTVWNDWDLDGINNDPAYDLPEITVELYDASNNTLSQSTTTTGNYVFNDVNEGTYYVKFILPTDYQFTQVDQGGDDTKDSDVTEGNGTGTTESFMLASGTTVSNVDAGMITSGSIGNFVWYDANENGIQDAGELGIPMMEISLFDEANMLVATTTTDAAGMYTFDNVAPGIYYLSFTYPAEIQPTIMVIDMSEVNSDISGTFGQGSTDLFFVGSGEFREDIDAGFVPSGGNILGQVWKDVIGNDIQEIPNVVVPNITVNLYRDAGEFVATMQTNEFGYYAFASLAPGTYYVEFVIGDTLEFVMPYVGNEDTDSEVTGANGPGTTDNISVAGSAVVQNVHAGVRDRVSVATIKGLVFEDRNGDGLQTDAAPYAGATVVLQAATGTEVANTLTAADGTYEFANVAVGDYYVAFSNLPAGAVFTMANVGADDNIDSDVTDSDNGRTDLFTITEGQIIDLDAGYYTTATIGDFVWNDANENGVQDAGETGLAGVEVTIKDGSGTQVDNFITGADGLYSFSGLAPGDYQLGFRAPEGFVASPFAQGGDSSLDSDAMALGGTISETSVFGVSSGETNNNIDAGFFTPTVADEAVISGLAWTDENIDGIRQDTEPRIAGLTVTLFNASNVNLGNTTTDADGAYSFTGLAAGNYYIVFDYPASAQPTLPMQGGDTSVDSDITGTIADGATTIFALATNEMKSNIDGGFVNTVKIGDFVWQDNNVNGIQDNGEAGLQNVTVNLLLANGTQIASDVTDVFGAYLFDNIPAGQYRVEFVLPSGYAFTEANAGDDDVDSDVVMNGRTEILNITSDNLDIDAGVLSAGSIGDLVFVDINGNGRKSNSEPGLNGAFVRLYQADGTFVAATESTTQPVTGQDGYYRFNNVAPGDYYVTFELPEGYLFTTANAGSNDEKDSDVTQSIAPGSTDIFTLNSGEDNLSIDAGAYLPGSIGDFVWNDLNANGIQDAGEPGIANVPVQLRRSNGIVLAETTTDASGNYCFVDLTQGLYIISIDIPAGYVATASGQGSDGMLDSDIDPTGATPLVSLAHGTAFKEVDAGLVQQGNNNLVSNVWFDANADGIRDENELPMNNVIVTLYSEQGGIVAQTATNNVGKYAFTNIAEGHYQIGVGIDDGFAATAMNMGNDDMMDSDVNSAGMSEMFVVDEGLSVPNIDAGLVEMTVLSEIEEQFTSTNEESGEIQNPKMTPLQAEDIMSGPNPFYNSFMLKLKDKPEDMSYQIVQKDGSLVAKAEITEQMQWIDLSEFVDGMYILIIYQGNNVVDKRHVMKVH